eukprot:CAMPEP_0179043688 /NCGR_PEP_ID=MMETSP0796-20121207/17292_1 /TAXON_ID=73915 /ORGANISM="Pyrodinium bahamense, Strain pbaha01" /LENGTH=66 /DNA_ID=CAMNT_0020740073 /DNA_START=112 /DNA_END=309 /DNA_ORIENTATION=+
MGPSCTKTARLKANTIGRASPWTATCHEQLLCNVHLVRCTACFASAPVGPLASAPAAFAAAAALAA